MNIVFLGADVPSNRVILNSQNVKHMGVSFWGLLNRGLPKTKRYELSNYFPEGVQVYVHAGLPSSKSFTDEEFAEIAADYEDFIAHNIDHIAGFTELDHPELSPLFIAEQRTTAWADVPEDKFWPVYTGGDLESLAVRYLNVAIPGATVSERPTLAGELAYLHQRHGTKFHLMGVAKPDLVRSMKVETMSTLAWLSPMMRGETIVWVGNRLVRYPKRMKEQSRPRHKAVYEKANLDFDKILEDDAVEVSRLAVWSLLQLELWYERPDIVTMSDDLVPLDNAETPSSEVTMRGSDMRKLVARKPEEITPLPVLGVEVSQVIETDDTGRDIIKDVPVIRSTSVSLRMCDTCFVASNCPAAKPQSSCAYNLPIEVKTKEQLKALINALVEMQGQRVAFAKFTEDLNGGYPDPNVGQEMDRFFKMLETIKKLDESKEMIRMTVERQGAGGVLSSIFGDRAQVLKELPNGGLSETQTNTVIQQIDPTQS